MQQFNSAIERFASYSVTASRNSERDLNVTNCLNIDLRSNDPATVVEIRAVSECGCKIAVALKIRREALEWQRQRSKNIEKSLFNLERCIITACASTIKLCSDIAISDLAARIVGPRCPTHAASHCMDLLHQHVSSIFTASMNKRTRHSPRKVAIVHTMHQATCTEKAGHTNREWCDSPAASSYRVDNTVQDCELTVGIHSMQW
jgi:hypothetical protein